MQEPGSKPAQSHLVRLPREEDVLVGPHRVYREYTVAFGALGRIGAVRSDALGHLEQVSRKIAHQILDTGQDPASLSGSIHVQGDDSRSCTCAVLCDAQGQVLAGELLPAAACVAEASSQDWKRRPQVRERDPETGLGLWPGG